MLINYREKTRTRRFASKMVKPKPNLNAPRSLKKILPKKSGRSGGTISVRHQAGRHKRYYREIDFKRHKMNIEGEVKTLEYDPNRNVQIALIQYTDGEKAYILAPQGLKVGHKVTSGTRVEIKVGNALLLKNVPIGTMLHNVELSPGMGGKIGRSAGTSLVLQAKEGDYAHLRLPSGEIRMIPLASMATVGVLGNEDWKNMTLGKAGRSRHMGIRPTVRGVAQDPNSHPHGGGEARAGIGRKKPMTKFGRPAVGKTRKPGKWTSKYILKRRK